MLTQQNRMLTPYPNHDPVTQFLTTQGIFVSSYFMGNTSMLLGGRFELEGFETVYRVENDTIILVVYRRIETQSNSLRNAFKPFIWFLERLVYDIPEIRFMRGNPDAMLANGKGLSNRQLYRFYCEVMGGVSDPEIGWYQLELCNYETMQQRRKNRRENS